MKDFSENIKKLLYELETADAVVIGIGAGMSASSGFDYSGERFEKTFGDFQQKYGITDMYSGGFYPFSSPEEYWAWWSRMIWINRYTDEIGKPYSDLLTIVRDKDYFIITTNVDHQVQKAGFDKKRLFYTQGDYGLFQCSEPCHRKTYDNKEIILKMLDEQEGMRIPSELIPYCSVCGKPMTTNLRGDDRFVQDDGWYDASRRYEDFLNRHNGMHILFLELGVGMNTPGIIKYPFWRMTAENPEAVYCTVNSGQAFVPSEKTDKLKLSSGDIMIGEILKANQVAVKAQKAMGIMASAMGNHEYDMPKHVAEIIPTIGFKLLACNVNIKPDNPLYNKIQKSYIQEVNGHKYGIIGITPVDLFSRIKYGKIFEELKVDSINSTIKDVQKEVDNLKKQGINKIILLSHVGFGYDQKIARETDGIDIILGGHSHNLVMDVKPGINLFTFIN